jgi:hypothetical protein
MSSSCTVNQIDPPFGSSIVGPEDIVVAWTSAANEFDLSGMMIFFDLAVFDQDGNPMENAKVEVTSNFSGVYLIPQEAVELVQYPGLPAGIESQDDVKEACTNEQGDYILAEDWCAWYWDTTTSQFFQFAGTYANAFTYSDTAGYFWYAPTHYVGQTDGRGLLRVYAMVDMLPYDAEGDTFQKVQILASIGVDSDVFNIDPSSD